jgi:hypothetical protein
MYKWIKSQPKTTNSECNVTISGYNSTISGICMGDMWTECSNNSIHVEANHCVIDIVCKNDGSCTRNMKCPLTGFYESSSHNLNEEWTSALPPN